MKQLVFSIYCILFTCRISAQEALNDFIYSRCTAEEVKHAQLGVAVFDADQGMLIGQYNHDKSFIPASSLKLLTSFVALDKLGKDFKFVTRLAYTGHITDSILHGNLYIIGSGDPSLGSKRFSDRPQLVELIPYFVQKIKQAGIKKIEGQLITDESVFDSYPISPSWQWNDLGSYYACGAWGINVNENEYEVWYNSNKPQGEAAEILNIYPAIADLNITSEVIVDNENNDERAYVFGGPYTHEKRIVGTIPQRKNAYCIRGSMPDPPRYLSQAVFVELGKAGIPCKGHQTKFNEQLPSGGLVVFDSIVSPTLSELVKMANYYSINLYSEAFLKSLGYHRGRRGSGTEGIRVIEKYLNDTGIDYTVLNMEDGSGLSARNRISPFLMTQLLFLQMRKFGNEYVAEYLPKSGEDGTVRRLLKNSEAFGNVWMKSGSMNQIMSYTGVMKTKSGKWVSFSLMSNGYTQKSYEMRKWMEITIEGIYLNG